MSKYLPKGIAVLPEDVLFNCRFKYFIDESGNKIPVDMMYSRRYIFNPNNAEWCTCKASSPYDDEREFWKEYYREKRGITSPVVDNSEENVETSKRRARRKITEYITCNDFKYFVTLTLNAELIDRTDYKAVVKKLNTFLDNRVRRYGLKYVGVPELHKNGGIHFHFLVNDKGLSLVDSGTVSVTGKKKPIKISTADRLKIPASDRHIVYNVADWNLGFSTAIDVYGERAALVNYVGKYITKGSQKIGGRWYYSGGKLTEYMFEYARCEYNEIDCFDYEFSNAGGDFKVKCF